MWPAHQPRRSPEETSVRGPIVAWDREGQRTEKTVPARSATEFEIRGKMGERTGWRGQNKNQIGGEEKRNGRLVGAAQTSKERAQWRRLQWKNLNILGLRKWNRTVSPEYQIMKGGESQDGRERGGSEREHGEERVEGAQEEPP